MILRSIDYKMLKENLPETYYQVPRENILLNRNTLNKRNTGSQNTDNYIRPRDRYIILHLLNYCSMIPNLSEIRLTRCTDFTLKVFLK